MWTKYRILLVLILLISNCSTDLLQMAFLKAPYEKEVLNFEVIQPFEQVSLKLTWRNPEDSDFDKVIIKRKLNSPPKDFFDNEAITVYSGKEENFIDNNVFPENIYYYKIFTKDKNDRYSYGVVAYRGVFQLTYKNRVSNFSIIQNPGTTDLLLNWVNPVDSDFYTVVILRKEDEFPLDINDQSADIVYSGNSNFFLDTALTVNITYCYTIFSISKSNKISTGISNSKKVVSIGESYYNQEVSDFTSIEGRNNREIKLSWINPSDTNFDSVLILRKINGYPISYNDNTATVVYTGKNETYYDSDLTPDNTYYYAIYTKNRSGIYSIGEKSSKNIPAENGANDINVRKRSFFLIGGSSSYPLNAYTNLDPSVDMYDPVTETLYSNVTTLPTPRLFCDIASSNGKIYVFGGYSSATTITNVVDILDVTTMTWSTGDNMPILRAGLRTAVWNNKIYVIGGTSNQNAATGANAPQIDGRRYDPLASPGTQWLADNNNIFKDINTARSCAMIAVFNGEIYYWGGVANTGSPIAIGGTYSFYYTILYNSENAFSNSGTIATVGRTSAFYHKTLSDGRELNFIFSIGGFYVSSATTALPHTGLNFASASNTVSFAQIPSAGNIPYFITLGGDAGSLNINRAYAGAECYGDYIYIFGGINGGALTSIERLNIDNGNFRYSWQIIGNLSKARYGFGITKVNF